MAAGVPVVATEIEGYASVVDDGVNGLLVPPKDDDQLADAIASLLRDPDLRARLSSNGLDRADEFRWERVAGRVMDYYHQFLDDPKAALPQQLLG
jgi:phosphatidylinositol alpha-mannosyltransferase